MYLVKLIISTLVIKFFCSIGVLETQSNKLTVQQSVNVEQVVQPDSVDQHKKMGASRHVPISIFVQ